MKLLGWLLGFVDEFLHFVFGAWYPVRIVRLLVTEDEAEKRKKSGIGLI